MFSSLLPNASSSMKFGQNGSSKPSNRFSVRVFKAPANAPMPFSMSQKFVDIGYRSAPQPEQQPNNWYPTSAINASYAPPTRSNYAIYPSVDNDTFIYEQSNGSKSDIFSNSEFDTASMTTFSPSSAFSPAMSTDSTMALKSPIVSDHYLDTARVPRSATPAVRPNYTANHPNLLQGPIMSRTTSNGHHIHEAPTDSVEERRSRMTSSQSHAAIPIRVPTNLNEPMTQIIPPGGFVVQLPEYAASTFSELEVEERDVIAKMNAEYNAAASATFYMSAQGPSGDASMGNDMRRMASNTSQNSSPTQRDAFTRVTTSQPLHPNLHFPIRPPGPQELDYPPPAFQQSASASVPAQFSHGTFKNGSPPSVERVPSQLPPEDQPPHANSQQHFQTTLPIASENWSRDATYNSDTNARTQIYRTSPQNAHSQPYDINNDSPPSSRSTRATYTTSSHGVQEILSSNQSDQRQDRPFPGVIHPTEPSRQRSNADRRSSSFAGGSRPDAANIGHRGVTDSRDYGVHAGSDYRQHDSAAIQSTGSTSSRGTAEPISSGPRDYTAVGYAGSSESHLDNHTSNSPPRGSSNYTSSRDASSRAAASSEMRREARTPAPRDRDRDFDEQQHRAAYPTRRESYIYAAPEAPSRGSKDRTSPEFKAGPLSASPKQMRVTPDEFDAAPTSNYPSPTHETDRTRIRSMSFSSSAQPSIPPSSSQTLPAGYHEPGTRGVSEHHGDRERDRDRRGRSSSISEKSPPSRTLDGQHHNQYPPTEPDRRVEPRSSQAPHASLASRERETPPQSHPQRQAATVQTASSTSSSRSSDSHHSSRRVQQSTTPSAHDSRTSYFDPIPPQPQVYSQQHQEPVRRQSDGDRPYNTSSVLLNSNAGRYEPPPSSALSSSSSTSSSHLNPSAPPFPEPHRRYSDGDQNPPPSRPALTGRNSTPLVRSVRWTENLVAPSPILANQRRKGFFNRRGDQLWTNDGAYKPAQPGLDYPPDLDEYPESGDGWMNEEGVRIDMGHRLIPKTPLRSALKTSPSKA